MYVTYVVAVVVVIIIVVIFLVVVEEGGWGEITDCKLNLLGMTARFCTLTIFVANLLQFFPHKL
jgi:hypothetical protein